MTPLSESTQELMVATLMEKYKQEAIQDAKKLIQGMTAQRFVLALPLLLIGTLESYTGLSGKELMERMEAEAWEQITIKKSNGQEETAFKNMTIPHAIYRMLNDSRVIATSAARNAALVELFGKDG